MKKRKWIGSLFFAAVLSLSIGTITACSSTDNPIEEPSIQAPLPETPNTEQTEKPEFPPTADTPVVTPIVTTTEYIRCTGDSVNFRTGAGTSYSVVGSAKKGEIYAVAQKVGNWYKTYYRGKEVYVSASYAALFSIQKENAKVESVLEEGYKLLGVPYVYGAVRFHDGNGKLLSGFSAQKFDCSSLVQYVFYKGAKTNLQVNTRTQIKQGKYVAKGNLQRGDCLFFTNESRQHLSGIERVGHVAIYLGDNYILHTASDYARIEKITAARWKFYIEARRFI